MSAPDPQLDRVRRAFNAAFQRMGIATTDADFEDELSNVLCQLYRLGELGKKRSIEKLGEKLGKAEFYKKLLDSNDLRMARAAMWARTFDIHDAIVIATPIDTYGDIYNDIYGAPAWKPLEWLPERTDKWGRHEDYRDFLAGGEVVTTIRRAFDALAALL